MLTIFCPQCYAENRAEDEVCGSCGTRLDEEMGDYVERLARFSLRHPVPSVPPMAAEVLGKLGDRRAVEPLVRALEETQNPGLMEAGCEALGRLGDERALPVLQAVTKRGGIPARLKAVAALKEIGGRTAIAALNDIAKNDASARVRKEALEAVGALGQKGKDRELRALSDAHKRGIAVSLTMLDEAMCEAEEWAKGREIRSVFYRESNTLTKRQRQKVLREVASLRAVLAEIQQFLGLEPEVQDTRSAIQSKCAGLWEHIVELKAKHLRRYGAVPPQLAEYIDPQVDRLIQSILDILDELGTNRRG